MSSSLLSKDLVRSLKLPIFLRDKTLLLICLSAFIFDLLMVFSSRMVLERPSKGFLNSSLFHSIYLVADSKWLNSDSLSFFWTSIRSLKKSCLYLVQLSFSFLKWFSIVQILILTSVIIALFCLFF